MNKFLDRFKLRPKGKKVKGSKFKFQLLGTAFVSYFKGRSQSLGGSAPSKVVRIELSEQGLLGIILEKRSNVEGTAIVAMVMPNSQAERAGLLRGDILCLPGPTGQGEIMYDQFLLMEKADLRPLCLEVRRIPVKKTASNEKNTTSAESYARKQAMIAAAEARAKEAKKLNKPLPKKKDNLPDMMSTVDWHKLEQERLSRQESQNYEASLSEASKQARFIAKQSEAQLAAQLGFNPYEATRAIVGQAWIARVAAQHGALVNPAVSNNGPGKVSKPKDASEADPSMGDERNKQVSKDFAHAFGVIKSLKNPVRAKNSLGIMRKLLQNARTNGQRNDEAAAQFRRVRLANEKIRAAIVDTEGAWDLMMSVGFVVIEEDEELLLVFPANEKSTSWLDAALQQMGEYIKS